MVKELQLPASRCQRLQEASGNGESSLKLNKFAMANQTSPLWSERA
jgi:hypothetical protein